MSKYTEAVERALVGLTAVSTGLCPGCDECMGNFDEYTVRETVLDSDIGGPDRYTFERANGATFDTEEAAQTAAREAFEKDWSTGHVYDEGGFSWSGCGICGNQLGNTMECWHGVDSRGRILHFDDACTNCVVYLANGDEPTDA